MSGEPYAIMIPPPPLEMLIWWWEAERRKARHDAPANARRRARYVSKAKYRPGRKVRSLDDLMRQERVYHCGRTTPRGWFRGWQIHYAWMQIATGRLRIAVPRRECRTGGAK